MLVLFPSYMWHGTVPFTGQAASRLSVAFDLVPEEEGKQSFFAKKDQKTFVH